MHFLYPAFLFALFLIAIPILLHLFNFRRYKKVIFSDIRFLKQITEQNKKQQTIKQWLILLCRVLAIAFLVFAFAQPFIPKNEEQTNKQNRWISIFVDNSFSMQANQKNGTLLELAKANAKKIADAYLETDKFQLLTNDFEGKHQRLVSKNDFLQMLEEIELSSVHRNFSEIFNRQKSLGTQMNAENGQFYWISDFQKNMEPKQWRADSLDNLFLVSVQGETKQNIWIDTAWFPEPILKMGSKNKLILMVKNESENNFENQAVVLKIDGIQKAIQNVSCKAGSKEEVSINFTLSDYNWHGLTLSITDFPIVFDDAYYLAAKAQTYSKVLLLQGNSESNEAIKKVFSLDPFYQLTQTDFRQIDYANFAAHSLIVLNEPQAISTGLSAELQKYVENGGALCFIPSANPSDLLSIQSCLNTLGLEIKSFQKQSVQVSSIETKDPLFDGVFSKVPELANLPVCNAYWQISGKGNRVKSVINLSNDLPFMLKSKMGSGQVFLLASSVAQSQSNFTQNPIFVPLMLRLPFQSKPNQMPSFNLGEQNTFSFEANSIQKIVTLKKDKIEHLIEVKVKDKIGLGYLNDQVKEAGVYSLRSEQEEWSKIAFNYSRDESSQIGSSLNELAQKLGAENMENDLGILKTELDQANKGTHYWRWALLFALLFLLLEMALLRSIKI